MIINLNNFSLDLTLNSGQTFIWKEVAGNYYSFVDKPVRVKQNKDKLYITGQVSASMIKEQLGLYDNIALIEKSIDRDEVIHKAIEQFHGIRVVKDGLWVSTLSFILSIQSNIKLIRRRVEQLSSLYGEEYYIDNISIHRFPSYEQIYKQGLEKLKTIKMGFRTKFVFDAAEKFTKNKGFEGLSLREIRENLSKIKGVGPKVLDCILLYGLHDLSAFPIDVWIRRIIDLSYKNVVKGNSNYKTINEKMVQYFGNYAGYAQLFLYGYARQSIGAS